MKLILIPLTLILSFLSLSQNFSPIWGGRIGGQVGWNGGYDHVSVIDGNNNLIVVGVFEGTADFDFSSNTTNLVCSGNSPDMFIAKYNSNGNLVWAKSIGDNTQFYEGAYSVAVDNLGNIIVTGFFSGNVDFDPGLPTNYFYSTFDASFVLKLDSNGSFLWAQKIAELDNNGYDFGISITTDINNNIYITGIFNGINDFDNGPGITLFSNLSGWNQTFILKLNSGGGFLWAKTFENLNNNSYNSVESIHVDDAFNVYLTGEWRGDIDFDPSLNPYILNSAYTNSNAYICKLNILGDFLWAKDIGDASGNDRGNSIITDGMNNVYCSGYFAGTNDFSDNATSILTANGSADIFVSKYTSTGNLIWAKQIGNNGLDLGNAITLDINDNLYATGIYEGNVDFDPGVGSFNLQSTLLRSIYLLKLDNLGDFVHAESIGGSINGQSSQFIGLDNNDHIYLTGNFNGTMDIDPNTPVYNISSVSNGNVFITKFCQTGNSEPIISIDQPLGCASSAILTSSSLNNNIWNTGSLNQSIQVNTPGNYVLTVTDAFGCSLSSSVDIDYPYDIIVTSMVQDACSYNEGTISVDATGGSSPYFYEWENGLISPNICGLSAGVYTVLVTDHNLCTTSIDITVGTSSNPSYFDYPNGLIITNPSQNLIESTGDSHIQIRGTLIIKNGVNYTINNKTIEFARDLSPENVDQGNTHSGIIVEPGAKLTINNSTLKGLDNCDAMWQGIQVWGDDYKKEMTHTYILKNGQLLLNNSTIRDAHIGIALYRVHLPYNLNYIEYGRGIVKAKHSQFINNSVSIAFSGKNYIENNSSIIECNFSCNSLLIDQCSYTGSGSDIFIALSRVKNPIIYGNTFNGNILLPIDQRATGIKSYNSSYIVRSGNVIASNPASPPTPNTFNNLTQGIDIYSMGGALKTVKIKDNRFNNVYQAITSNGSNFDEISFNRFNVPLGDINLNSWGVFLESSSGFLVTENIFNSTISNNFTFGMVARESNLMNARIYKNVFNGNFFSATQAEGLNNLQLNIDCNNYLGTNIYDWTILSNTMASQGVCGPLPTDPQSNLFGSCVSGTDDSQIFSSIGFTYNSSDNVQPVCVSPLLGINICSPYDAATSCPQLVTDPCPSCMVALQGQFNNTPPGQLRNKIKAELIRGLAHAGNTQELIDVLNVELSLEDKKILIPTHLDNKEFNQARLILNSLDLSLIENQKYYELYDILTYLGETNRELNEITLFEKMQIQNVADSEVEVSINAQAILAEINNLNYIRFPQQISNISAMMINPDNPNPSVINSKCNFDVYPNPSDEDITIQLSVPLKGQGQIIDVLGRTSQLFELNDNESKYDIISLSKGIYTIVLSYDNGVIESKRLIIN